MQAQVFALANEYHAARQAGDRPRMLAILRRLKEMLRNIDTDKIANFIEMFEELIGGLFPAPSPDTAKVLAVTEFEREELEKWIVAEQEETTEGASNRTEAQAFDLEGARNLVKLIQLIFTFLRLAGG